MDEARFWRYARPLAFLGRRVARFDFPPTLPGEQPVILAGNHRSFFDFLAGICFLVEKGIPMRPMLASEYFDFPVLGWMLRGLQCIPVERSRLGLGSLKIAGNALAAGESVVIMPEGRLVPPDQRVGGVGDANPGVGLLVQRSRATVVGFGAVGCTEVWPMGRPVPLLRRFFRRGPVTVKMQVVDIDADLDRVGATAAIMETIRALVAQAEQESGRR